MSRPLSKNWLKFFKLCYYGSISLFILMFIVLPFVLIGILLLILLLSLLLSPKVFLFTDKVLSSNFFVLEVMGYSISIVFFIFLLGMTFYSFVQVFLKFKTLSLKEKIEMILPIVLCPMLMGHVWFYRDHIKTKTRHKRGLRKWIPI